MRVLSVSHWHFALQAFRKQEQITRKFFIMRVLRKASQKWLQRGWSFLAFLMQLIPRFYWYLLNELSWKAALVPKSKFLKSWMGWYNQLMLGICQNEGETRQIHQEIGEMAKTSKSHIKKQNSLWWDFLTTYMVIATPVIYWAPIGLQKWSMVSIPGRDGAGKWP